jgi:hypothetical protein
MRNSAWGRGGRIVHKYYNTLAASEPDAPSEIYLFLLVGGVLFLHPLGARKHTTCKTHVNLIFHESFYGRPPLKQPSGLLVSLGKSSANSGWVVSTGEVQSPLDLNTHTHEIHIYVGMLIGIEGIALFILGNYMCRGGKILKNFKIHRAERP